MSVPFTPIIYKRPFAPSNRVELYWQPPVSDGGSNITSYILESANIPYIEILPSTTRRAIVGNLTNGTDYVFTIKATNINGNGNVAVYDTFQPGFIPLNPTNLDFTSNIDNFSKIQFTFNNTIDTGNSKILYNVVTMTPVDVTGNILDTSSLKYYVSARESNIVNPVVIDKVNTNYDYKSFVRSRNSVNFSDKGNADFIVNPNLPTNGLKLWLDPYDITTITLSNSKVTRWVDKSKNRANATVSEAFAPTYDSNTDVMVFNGRQYLNLPANTLPSGNTSYTIYTYVSTSNIIANNQWFLYSGTPEPNLSLGGFINNGFVTQSWFGSQLTANSNISASISYLLEMNYNNGIIRTLINGNLIAQNVIGTRNSTTGNNIIGSNSTFNANLNGTIGDIIIYDRLLNDIERASVENYLEKKKLKLSLQNMGNLVVWLDPSDNNTLYDENIKNKIAYNNNVYSWLDKSGNNNNARQSNISILPIRRPYIQNNLDVLEFNQSYLTIPAAYYPLDAYMIIKLNSLNDTYGLLGIGPNSNNYSSLSYNTSGGNLWSINNTSNTIISGNIETSSNFLLMELSISGNSNVIRRFGSNISNVTTGIWTLPANSNIIIGNNNGFDFSKRFKGYMGELIMFNRQLIDSDRQQIEGYLAWKWGLQSNLLSNHPYKNSAPYLFNRYTFVVPTGFNPLTIPGLQLWMDANDASTFVLSGSTITRWNDKGYSGNYFYNATGNHTYITDGTRKVVNCVPTNIMQSNTNLNYTTNSFVFCVSKNNGGDGAVIGVGTSGADKSMRYYGGVILGTNLNRGDSNDLTQATLWANGNEIVPSGTFSTYNQVDGNPRDNTSQKWFLSSSSRYFNGYICEILLYDSLTLYQRYIIQGYLTWKWGLQTFLPSTHLFKNAAPDSTINLTSMNPINFGSLYFWIDISNTASLTFSGSSRTIGSSNYNIVTQVNDLSGGNRNMTIRGGTTGPVYFSTFDNNLVTNHSSYAALPGPMNVYNYPGLLFRGRGTSGLDSLSATLNGSSQPMTFFIISRDSPNGCLFGSSDNSDYFIHYSNTYDMMYMPGYQIDIRSKNKGSYEFVLESICYSGVSGRAQILYQFNGVQANGITNTTSGAYAGFNNFIINGRTNGETTNGTIHELLIFTSVLKMAEIKTMEGYLAWKWGLVANLPSDHPYKNIQPSSKISFFSFEFLASNFSSSTWINSGNTGTFGSLYQLTGYNTITTSADSYGNYLNFSGINQYLQLPTKLTFNFNNYEGFTYICVAKFNSANNYERFFDFGNGQASDNIAFSRQGTNSIAYFEIYNGGSAIGSVSTASNYLDSNWHIYGCMATLSSSGTNYKIFRDNINSYWGDTTVTSIPSNRTTSINYIGRSNWSADSYFNGNIRYVNFLTSSMSTSDLSSLLANLRTQYGIV